jgi:PadR family transcriptional regulator PadR
MGESKLNLLQGTLDVIVLQILAAISTQHGYSIARGIEQVRGEQLALNPGTLYPLLLRLEQGGAMGSEWPSENNRQARFYRLTWVGRNQWQAELASWHQTADIIARFLAINMETPL